RHPKEFGTSSNLFTGPPSSVPCPSLRRMSRERSTFNGWLFSSRAISEDPMPRYKCKNVAALDIALGGLPAKMHVEADVSTGVSGKTVGEIRKGTTWSENFVITTPQERHPEKAVKISKAKRETTTATKLEKARPRTTVAATLTTRPAAGLSSVRCGRPWEFGLSPYRGARSAGRLLSGVRSRSTLARISCAGR